MESENKKTIFSITTFFISIILLFISSELLLRLTGYQPWRYDVRVNEPIIFEPDPVLGWKNKPGNYIYPAYSHGEEDIKLTHLADGSRVTEPGITKKFDEREKIVIVGGSFTQGFAISDHETYPWKLQHQYPSVKVLNYGTGGHGTYQSLLALERFFADRSKSPKIVLYGFIGPHEYRNVAVGGWLKVIARHSGRRRGRHQGASVPYCTIDSSETLIRHPAERYPAWPLRDFLATVTFVEKIYMRLKTLKRGFQRQRVTEKLLLEMNEVSKKRGTTLMVILLSLKGEKKSHYRNFLEQKEIEFVDCVYPLKSGMRVKGEGHPNGKMNTLWANCIAKAISGYF